MSTLECISVKQPTSTTHCSLNLGQCPFAVSAVTHTHTHTHTSAAVTVMLECIFSVQGRAALVWVLLVVDCVCWLPSKPSFEQCPPLVCVPVCVRVCVCVCVCVCNHPLLVGLHCWDM